MKLFVYVALAASMPAVYAEPDILTGMNQHIQVPSQINSPSITDMLNQLAIPAGDKSSMPLDQAQRLGRRKAQQSCPQDDEICKAENVMRQKLRTSEKAPGRLDPLLAEYVIDQEGSASGCADAGMRQREKIWSEQFCRRDEDYANLNFDLSSNDTYLDKHRNGDVVVIRAGTAGDNYWRNNVFERSFTFELPTPAAFVSFVIEHVHFDDWLLLEVNDTVAYVGPYGGDRLEPRPGRRVCYAAGRCGKHELGRNWNRTLNLDILPLLRRGTNRIFARIVVGGGGEFNMRMRAVYDSLYVNAGSGMQRCSNLQAAGCRRRQAGSCVYAKDGECLVQAQAYDCPSVAPSHRIVSCSMPEICTGDRCSAPSAAANHADDFAPAVAQLEIGRQAGAYMNEDLRIFAGTSAVCRDKVAWGAQDCCRGDSAGRSNSNAALLAQLSMRAVKRLAPAAGSPYVYDALYAQDLAENMNSMLGMLPSGAAEMAGNFSYYGIQVKLSGGSIGFGFDPTSFAVAVAASIIADLLSCRAEEQLLGLRTGAGLCSKYRERCSGWFCRTQREYYCCYNSVLAKQIAVQGWPQLGRDYSQSNSCPGFTAEQVGRLDFSAIDLTEFIEQIQPATALPRQTSYRTDADAALHESIRVNAPRVSISAP